MMLFDLDGCCLLFVTAVETGSVTALNRTFKLNGIDFYWEQ